MGDQTLVCFDGALIEEKKAVISAAQTGIYYGTGCFETMLAENSQIFFFEEHYQRLVSGMNYLEVPGAKIPSESALIHEIAELLKATNLEKERVQVRIQVILAENAGYYPDDQSFVHRLIQCKKVQPKTMPAKLITAKTRVIPSVCRPANIKLSNMLHYRQAFREAVVNGCDDALMLTLQGIVAETSVANIFWKKGDNIFTPAAECDILPGIMRNTIIHILKKSGFNVRESEYEKSEIFDSEAVWLTNSVAEIWPAAALDSKELHQSNSFIVQLRENLERIKKSENTS